MNIAVLLFIDRVNILRCAKELITKFCVLDIQTNYQRKIVSQPTCIEIMRKSRKHFPADKSDTCV